MSFKTVLLLMGCPLRPHPPVASRSGTLGMPREQEIPEASVGGWVLWKALLNDEVTLREFLFKVPSSSVPPWKKSHCVFSRAKIKPLPSVSLHTCTVQCSIWLGQLVFQLQSIVYGVCMAHVWLLGPHGCGDAHEVHHGASEKQEHNGKRENSFISGDFNQELIQ